MSGRGCGIKNAKEEGGRATNAKAACKQLHFCNWNEHVHLHNPCTHTCGHKMP